MTFRILAALLALLLSPAAWAHLQPTTLAVLNADSGRANLTLHLPLSELQLAFGHRVNDRPEARMASWSADLRQYLIEHTCPTSPDGKAWAVEVLDMALGSAEQTQSGPFQEVNVRLALTPPPGGDARRFELHYDAIMHQVVTHKAVFSVRSGWGSGNPGELRTRVIYVNNLTSRVEPLEVDLAAGSWFAGFAGMVRLGMRHIREGLDHLLFLMVLLLAASGSDGALLRVARIVTAFTLGHSATLAVGALHWLQAPQQPVEVLIAVSILVTAIHAIRPLFPGGEAKMAAGFGLVHGMAFASAISDLNLPPGPLALSILGFNAGIEMMQLAVIALTMPWLILLSRTRAYIWVRIGGAAMAVLAAAGWMVNRISGQPNWIETWTGTATKLAPLGIVLLAAIAIPSYFYPVLKAQVHYTREGRQEA